jgi:hypothetical protein
MSKRIRDVVESAAPVLGAAHEILDDLDDLGGHIGLARTAVIRVQRRRLRRFLRALATREQELNDEERAQLYQRLDSKMGQEFIADAIDAVIRTHSRRAAAALGLLVGDPSDERFPPTVRRKCVRGPAGALNRARRPVPRSC